MILDESTSNNIPVNPENTDYKRFKEEINNETAFLKDVDGNVMTTEEAKAYVALLPSEAN